MKQLAPVILVCLCACVGEIEQPRPSPLSPPSPGGVTPQTKLPEPSPTVLRRLTRDEYRNSIADVLDVSPPEAVELPDDSHINNFVTTAGLSLNGALTTRYLDAAAGVGVRLAARLTALLHCDATATESGCLRSWLTGAGIQLFRRPMTEGELTHYLGLFESARVTDSFTGAATLMFEAMLVSPQFLFIETASNDGVAPMRLDPWQMASRLSFTLWKSAPDLTLLEAAARGELTTPETLAPQVQRLMADPRARRSVTTFFDGWLLLDAISQRTRFPIEERASLTRDSRAFVDDIFWNRSGDFRALVGGLFKQRGVLVAMSANPDSAIIYRGKYIRMRLLCGQLPAPPAAVPPLPDVKPGVTSRERIAAHTSAASCNACHSFMNPLGYALEHYDVEGKYRELDNGLPIDTVVKFSEPGFTANVTGADDFATQLASSPAAQACVVRQMFTFVFDRPASKADAAVLSKLGADFSASGYDLEKLLIAFTRTDAFYSRLAPKESSP